MSEIAAPQVAVVRNCIQANEVEIERLQKRVEQLHACLAELQREPELRLLHKREENSVKHPVGKARRGLGLLDE